MRFIIILFLAGSAFSVSAQTLFNEQALITNLNYLSSDSLKGRKTESAGNATARTFIKQQFVKLGLTPFGNDFELPFEFTQRSGTTVKGINVAGWIKGKSDTYIVISAHYDHLGVRNEQIFNGADDNASGTCALFALAEYFQKNKPVHNLIIVAFDAEEMGLQGARAFVKTPPVPVEKIRLNINMDMIARADKNEIVACGTFYYPELKPIIESVPKSGAVKIIYGHDDPAVYKGEDNWTSSSDHGPFHSVKIPFIYFGVEDHKDYHQATDDFEAVNPDVYKSCVKLIVLTAAAVDKGIGK